MLYNVGTRRELFVDETFVQSFLGTQLVLQKPERRETVLEFDAPWENNVSFPYRVLPFKGGWRMYYRSVHPGSFPGGRNLCYCCCRER